MSEVIRSTWVDGKATVNLTKTQAKKLDAAARLLHEVANVSDPEENQVICRQLRKLLIRYAPDHVDQETGALLPAKPRDEKPAGEGERSPAGPEPKGNEELAA